MLDFCTKFAQGYPTPWSTVHPTIISQTSEYCTPILSQWSRQVSTMWFNWCMLGWVDDKWPQRVAWYSWRGKKKSSGVNGNNSSTFCFATTNPVFIIYSQCSLFLQAMCRNPWTIWHDSWGNHTYPTICMLTVEAIRASSHYEFRLSPNFRAHTMWTAMPIIQLQMMSSQIGMWPFCRPVGCDDSESLCPADRKMSINR